jgi:hypothetical protein
MRVVRRRRATHLAYILLSRTKCRSVLDEDKRDLVETLSSRLDGTSRGLSAVGELLENSYGKRYRCMVSAPGDTKI